MKETIVIFGANGNLGSYFIDYLIEKIDLNKFEIIASGRQDCLKDNKNVEYYQIDITKKEDFKKLPKKNIKAVVDFAGILPAYTSTNDYEKYINVNINGTLNILNYCIMSKAERIMYMQTWADLNGYLKEQKPLEPYSPRKLIYTGDHAVYAITKCAAMDLIEHYHQEFGINNYIFRLPNIYLFSPEKYYYVNGEKKLISYRYLIDKAIKGEDLELWGNPNKGKDIVYVKDLCQMIFNSIFTEKKSGIYNVGTGIKTTMEEQIKGIIEVFSPKDNPSKIIYKPEKQDCDDFVMNIDNAKEDLNYEPKYKYIDYLRDYKKEMEKYNKNY